MPTVSTSIKIDAKTKKEAQEEQLQASEVVVDEDWFQSDSGWQ